MDPRLRVIRADFFGELQKDEALYAVHRQINVPPLREAQLREVASKPPEVLSARFETSYWLIPGCGRFVRLFCLTN